MDHNEKTELVKHIKLNGAELTIAIPFRNSIHDTTIGLGVVLDESIVDIEELPKLGELRTEVLGHVLSKAISESLEAVRVAWAAAQTYDDHVEGYEEDYLNNKEKTDPTFEQDFKKARQLWADRQIEIIAAKENSVLVKFGLDILEEPINADPSTSEIRSHDPNGFERKLGWGPSGVR